MPEPITSPPRTIAVDFDGTLCDWAYPGIGKVKEGAKEALALFRRLGFRILIWSCRTSNWYTDIFKNDISLLPIDRPETKDMIAFLEAEGLEYDEVDDGSKGKPLADYYIDDRGVRFRENWPEIASIIQALTIGPNPTKEVND